MASTQVPGSAEPFLNHVPAQFVELGMQRLDTLLHLQKEWLGTIEQINRSWVARAQSEASLVSAMASKLTAARNLPDATTVCQEWISQHMQLATEDSRRLLKDGERLLDIGARALTNGANGFAKTAPRQ